MRWGQYACNFRICGNESQPGLQLVKKLATPLWVCVLTKHVDHHTIWVHSFFFIRTSNFDAEAERSYIFWRFEAETFLKMFLNLPGIVFQPISADVTRQTIKEHFLLRYGIKLLAHTGLTCSDATCEMSRQPTLAKFGFKKRIDHRGLQQWEK